MEPTTASEAGPARATRAMARAWDWLSGPRLGIGCMAVLLAQSAAGLVASDWLRRHAAHADPAVVSWLRLLGLTDVVHSAWFISMLILLGLNLLLGLVNGFSDAWSEAFDPTAGEGALLFELEAQVSKEAFPGLAQGWAEKEVGAKPTPREEGDAPVFEVQRGRFTLLLRWFGHLAVVAALFGGVLMMTRGFQARAIIEEGTRAPSLELQRGTPPMDWLPLVEEGKPLPGYWDPGFEIEQVPLPDSPLPHASWLRFYEEGKLVRSMALAPGQPARFKDLTVHWVGYTTGSTQNVSLTVTDSKSGDVRRFRALARDQNVDLEDFRFKVVEVRPETEANGASVQVEYQVPGHEAERFWLFAAHPNYDFAHRKSSEQHFTLEKVSQRVSVELLVGKEPGASLLWGGLAVMALCFWLALLWPEEKYWLRWSPGKIELTGWSPKPARLEGRFRRLAERLIKHVDALEAAP